MLPKTGVYVTRTRDLEIRSRTGIPSPTSVTGRPSRARVLTVETFLLEPLEDAHPERIEVSFLAFVQDERKFETPEALKVADFARRRGGQSAAPAVGRNTRGII